MLTISNLCDDDRCWWEKVDICRWKKIDSQILSFFRNCRWKNRSRWNTSPSFTDIMKEGFLSLWIRFFQKLCFISWICQIPAYGTLLRIIVSLIDDVCLYEVIELAGIMIGQVLAILVIYSGNIYNKFTYYYKLWYRHIKMIFSYALLFSAATEISCIFETKK